MADIRQIVSDLIKSIDGIATLDELEQKRIEYLGKSGVLTGEFKKLAGLDGEEKRSFGQAINECKEQLSFALDQQKSKLINLVINARLVSETLDLTLPARARPNAKIHPISQVTDELIAIFASLGFSMAEGPEIDSDFHNFTALNIPQNHPARQMHDTFYMPDVGQLLRTHTSTVQIRKMSTTKPPFRFISPGRVYRCDSDITHTPMFHQIEAVCIDKDINMAHLRGCIGEALRLFFETNDIQVRFRPHFFPFTEPSAEVDIGYSRIGDRIEIGKGDRWLEILGCGMVHPKVLTNVGIDPKEYQGFAFGMGIERIAMLKYGIADLRTFFDGDMRWLEKYGFEYYDVPTAAGRGRV